MLPGISTSLECSIQYKVSFTFCAHNFLMVSFSLCGHQIKFRIVTGFFFLCKNTFFLGWNETKRKKSEYRHEDIEMFGRFDKFNHKNIKHWELNWSVFRSFFHYVIWIELFFISGEKQVLQLYSPFMTFSFWKNKKK